MAVRALFVLSLAAAVGCTASVGDQPAGSRVGGPSPVVMSATAASTSTATVATAIATTSTAASTTATVVGPPPPHSGPMATFHDGLRALAAGQRDAHVRVMWLGDSHAQADFWPDDIRKGLQKRFGNAGPGFVHLGYKRYRHTDIKHDVRGKWRFRPKQPSTIEPWGDGAFGLGGILHAGYADRRVATVSFVDESLAQRKMQWDLCYKLGLAEDRFIMTLGDGQPVEIAAKGKDDTGQLKHIAREAVGNATMKIDIKAGRTDFCGLTIESDPKEHPGVVLDNLGINGARYATPLAWNEQAWAAEVKRRLPDLFIFEYGGNEASDYAITPKRYKQNALSLIARARRIRPNASCLVIGPTDRADAEAKIPPINDAIKEAAAEANCMFWNSYQIMGGKGSLRRWRDEDKAAPDGVHLKPKGYAEIGALLLADMMADYQR